MKRIFTLIISAVLLTTGTNAFAQSAWAVKANPLSLIYLTGNIQTEVATWKRQSINLGAHFSSLKIGDFSYSGFGITPEYRFYLTGSELNGFYVGPYLRYQQFSVKQKATFVDPNTLAQESFTYEFVLSRIGAGAIVGKEWMFKSGFTLDIYSGIGFVNNDVKLKVTTDGYKASVSDAFAEGFAIRGGLTLGFGKRKK